MTIKILKSQMPAGFAVAVAAYAKELKDWRDQEKIATEHDSRTDLAEIDRYVHRKKPTAPTPLIERAVNEAGVVDYELVDDAPLPADVLAAKKQRLFDLVSRAEHDALLQILPHGKRRLMSYRVTAIREADQVAVNKAIATYDAANGAMLDARFKAEAIRIGIARRLFKQSLVSKLLTGAKDATPEETAQLAELDAQAAQHTAAVEVARADVDNPEPVKVKSRNADDHAFITDYEARLVKIDAVQRWAAQTTSDVDDLTAANIDSWKMPDLPK